MAQEAALNSKADSCNHQLRLCTADKSQQNPEDLQEHVSKFHSEKDTKIPSRMRTETVKLILSYFQHPWTK